MSMAVRNEREKRDYERNENSTRTYFRMIRMRSLCWALRCIVLYCVVVGIIRDMCLVMMMGCAILLTLYIQD